MTLFSELSEQQILALAISSEDDDARTYMSFANQLHDDYPASAHVFIEMAEEEHEHRRMLQELYVKKFGDHIPMIRRSEIADFIKLPPIWKTKNMGLEAMRKRAELMELEAYRFYKTSAEKSLDKDIAALLAELAQAEKGHENLAAKLGEKHLDADTKLSEK